MKDQPDQDVTPLTAGAHLPAPVISIPTAEVLKQLLEQVLENERRRVRNEFIRLGLLFLLVILLILGGGYWFARNLLQQVQAERQLSEITRLNLLKTMSQEPHRPADQPRIITAAASEPLPPPQPPAPAPAPAGPRAAPEPAAPPPVTVKPIEPAVAPTAAPGAMAGRSAAMADRPQTAAPIMPPPVTAPPLSAPKTVEPPAPVSAVKPAVADEFRSTPEPYLKSLVVPVRDDLPLRLPIPSP